MSGVITKVQHKHGRRDGYGQKRPTPGSQNGVSCRTREDDSVLQEGATAAAAETRVIAKV